MSTNIENIHYDDFKNICRACLLHCDVKFIRDPLISNVYLKLTNIHFGINDDLPQNICLKCFEKINEIHEFAFQCLRSHSTLMKCLKNIQESQLNNDQKFEAISDKEEFHELLMNLEENISIDEIKIEYEEDIKLQSNDNVNNEREDSEVISENSINSGENILPSTRELNNDQIINCSGDEAEEQSNSNSIVNDLSGNMNSSNNSVISDKDEKVTDENKTCKSKVKQSSKPITRSSNPSNGKYCIKSSKLSSDLKKHKRTHTDKPTYKCKQCLKSFTRPNHLLVHMHIHSGERPFKCNQCPKAFSNSSNLVKHRRIHSGERPYKCRVCSKSFIQSSYLKTHAIIHSSERLLKCNICLKSYTQSNGLKAHAMTHTGERPYKRNQSPKAFSSSSNLINNDQEIEAISGKEELHDPVMNLEENITIDEIKIEYEEDIKLQPNDNVNNELVKSEVISENSNNSEENILPRTQGINNDQIKNYSENEAEEQSNSNLILFDLSGNMNSSNNTLSYDKDHTETDLNNSIKSKEKQSSKPYTSSSNPNNDKYYIKSSKLSPELENHERTHTGKLTYKCNQCSKSFTRSSNLSKHIRSHNGERPFKCNQCPKAFSNSSYLTKHKHIHSVERPFKCNQCPKAFKNSSGLKKHKRIHSGERPFKCNQCPKAFRNSSDLKKHRRIHSGERPFKCNQCPKAFSVSSSLITHRRIHSGERPYKCKVCSKSFIQSSNLKTHAIIHSNERSNKCNQCSITFSESA